MAFLLSKMGFWGLIGSVIASGVIVVGTIVVINEQLNTPDVTTKEAVNKFSEEAPKPETETPKPETETPKPETETIEAETETTEAETETTEPEKENIGTSVLRVDGEGNTLVAGKIEPNSKVKIVVGDKVLGEATSDEGGDYVIIGKVENDGSAQEVRIATKSNSEPDSVAALSDNNKDDEWILTEDIFVILPVQKIAKYGKKYETAAEKEASEKLLPVVLKSNLDEIKIVQSYNTSSVDKVTIDLISYSESGEVKLAGRSTSESLLNIYLDNDLRYSTVADFGGAWEVVLTDLEPSVYTLRVDEVSIEENRVISRILTPFKKIRPSALENVTERSITVMPGNSLWRIARSVYGRGILYVEIFEENKSLIEDPNLIFPGQIFNLPMN